MDCGIPYCHNGCPVNNQIPDWNDLVYRGDWEEASRNLHSTNNFPEFTGRICPAPCEASCTLNLTEQPVTIKTIECAIVDRAFANGLDQARRSSVKQDRQDDRGDRLRAGRPRLRAAARPRRARGARLRETRRSPAACSATASPTSRWRSTSSIGASSQMEAEGVKFHCNVNVGNDVRPAGLLDGNYDAVVLAGGAEKPRDLPIPGRDLATASISPWTSCRSRTAASANESLLSNDPILATGKHVMVIGGGDTGSDCIGTSIRQGALSVTQLEIMPEPPVKENKLLTWPDWPLKLRTSSSQEEGANRDFAC